MNQKINLISSDLQKIDSLENINIQNINNIFPYSCELLVCKYFNIFEEHDAEKALDLLIDKIRPNGQLIIGVASLNKICSDFLSKKINNKDFFDYIKNIHNHIGLDDILEYIDKNNHIDVIDINYDQEYIHFITITKNK
jgi:hypothetical protein